MQFLIPLLFLAIVIVPLARGVIIYEGHFTLHEEEFDDVLAALKGQTEEYVKVGESAISKDKLYVLTSSKDSEVLLTTIGSGPQFQCAQASEVQ